MPKVEMNLDTAAIWARVHTDGFYNPSGQRDVEQLLLAVDGLVASLAHTRTDLDGATAALQAATAAMEAERAARSRYEIIVLAARRLIAGPDSEHYTILAAAIDAHDQAMKEASE